MSKNKVQFQTGYSLIELFKNYGTENQCAEALFKWRWLVGFRCSQCGSGRHSVEEFTWLNTLISNVKNATGTYHAINPKHLPRYLAEFCYRHNRRFQLDELLPRFVYVAVRTPPMPGRLLKLAEAYR